MDANTEADANASSRVVEKFWLYFQTCELKKISQDKNTCTMRNSAKASPSRHIHTLWLDWNGLEFNSPVNTIKDMSRQSVYLTTLFLGRLSPLSG